MANILYPLGKQHILNGDIDFDTDTIKAVFLLSTYTYSSAHEYYDDVSASAIGTPTAIASPSITNGVFDGDPTTLTAVSGSTCNYVLVFKDTGTPSSSILIGLWDTTNSGLPVTPDGGNIQIQWDTGANKIFAL